MSTGRSKRSRALENIQMRRNDKEMRDLIALISNECLDARFNGMYALAISAIEQLIGEWKDKQKSEE